MKLITLYWRDIPAQVVGRQGRKSDKTLLSSRFQVAIDRAAMRAGKGSSKAYLEEWRREIVHCDQDITTAIRAEVKCLEMMFSDADLDALARNHGVTQSK